MLSIRTRTTPPFHGVNQLKTNRILADYLNTFNEGTPCTFNIATAENAAIFRTYVSSSPMDSPFKYADFFDDQLRHFRDKLFLLDQALEHALGSGKLSAKFYDRANGTLDIRMLRKGWADYFQGTKVLVCMLAIDPTYLRIFLERNFEQDFLRRGLAERWNEILARCRRRRTKNQAMKRRLQKAQARQESAQTHNSAKSQAEIIP